MAEKEKVRKEEASAKYDATKIQVLEGVEAVRKRKIGTERIRLTIGDSRGPALADWRKTIQDYCPDATTVLVFKDLGLQI